MKGPTTEDLIHRYVMGRMSEPEREDFESRMASDSALASKVAIQEEAYKLARKAGPQHLKQRLRELEDQPVAQPPERPVRRAYFRRLWLAAAALALLIIAGWWLADQSRTPSTEALMAIYMKPYRNPGNLRGEANSILLRSQAAEAYAVEDFSQSALLWERLMMVEGGGTPQDQFYLGVSLLFSKPSKPGRALRQFEQLLKTDHDYVQQSLWYAALAGITAGEQEIAKAYLNKLVALGDYHLKEAELLLNSLESE